MRHNNGRIRRGLASATLVVATLLASPGSADNPANDPDSCIEIWEAIGLPETEDDAGRTPVPVCHLQYIVGHSPTTGTPDWVIEHVTRAIAQGKNKRPKISFKSEPNLPAEIPRGDNKDYTNSGFDRGHLAPSNDFKSSSKLMRDTFYYSNAVPQRGVGFNQGIWKQLEALVVDLAINRGEVYVITGPIYQEKPPVRLPAAGDACGTRVALRKLPTATIGANKIAVPAALYKIVYDPYLNRLNAYVLPNIDHRRLQKTTRDIEYLEDYRVGLGTVEKLTGLSFIPALGKRTQRILRATCPGTMVR